MIWENGQYAIGDMVFFDWEGNSEIDHVALVSDVRPDGMPRFLLDATGVINSNPSGRAAELPWEDFHDRTVRGHARWNGLFTANSIVQYPTQIMQTSILASGARVEFYSITTDGINLSNLALGEPIGLVWETVNSFPLHSEESRYYINVSLADLPETATRFAVQIFDNGMISTRTEVDFDLTSGSFQRFIITTADVNGEVGINLSQIDKNAAGQIDFSPDQP